jgi:hypothetical protein
MPADANLRSYKLKMKLETRFGEEKEQKARIDLTIFKSSLVFVTEYKIFKASFTLYLE